MQTFTLTTGRWLQRLIGRNPIVRGSDRLEAGALVIVLIVALLALPLAGAVGTAVFDARTHTAAAQQRRVQLVDAIATQNTTIIRLPYQASLRTPLMWQFDGRDHSGVVFTDEEMKAGDRTRIWVDATGTPTVAPLSRSDAVTVAVIAAVGFWAAVAGTGAGLWALYRRRLERLRYADWDRRLGDLVADKGRRNRDA